MKITYELICDIIEKANQKQHPSTQAYIVRSDNTWNESCILIDGDLRQKNIEQIIKEMKLND
jgi:hypothetical protein